MMKEEKTIHYLYKIVCNITGRWYIGMHSAYKLEDYYMGSGKRLRYSIRKYGVENHTKEILELFESRELLIDAEKKAITSEMLIDNMCMNLRPGGEGGFISKEQQRQRSVCGGNAFAEKLKNDISFKEEHRERVSKNMSKNHILGKIKYNTFEGKTHSDETKKLISDLKKGTGIGENNSQYGTCWITKDDENKKIKKEEFDTWSYEGWVKGRK